LESVAGNNTAAEARPGDAFPGLRELLGWSALGYLVLVTACVVYFDDIQIRSRLVQDAPTIYNVRVFGAKIIDLLSISLMAVTAGYQMARGRVTLTPVHRNMLIIFGVYCYAALVGFVYGFFYSYDYVLWLQDFQQVTYLAGWFLVVFHLLDTKPKWRFYASAFLVLLALKNYLILYQTLSGVGKAIGDWAFRASQNAEFTYFPMLFFPLAVLLLRSKSARVKILLGATAVVYLFNSLIGIYRTVWVMLILGTLYLMLHLSAGERFRLVGAGVGFLALVVVVISLMFPRFVDLAFGYKFLSIFEWSTSGDRSNATRMIEVFNVVHRLFANFAIFQGMGLGAWWDDSARRLLQDYGSGFTFKWRYNATHMLYITQLLKLGLVGTLLYWFAFVRIFRFNSRSISAAAARGWEGQVALGLLVGLFCAVASSADFVRMFLVMGVNIALLTSYATLFGSELTAGGGGS
jgi:hypothetical protein